jgi:hypothetical protein
LRHIRTEPWLKLPDASTPALLEVPREMRPLAGDAKKFICTRRLYQVSPLHDSDYPSLLTGLGQLCLDGCQQVKQDLALSKFKHDAMTKDRPAPSARATTTGWVDHCEPAADLCFTATMLQKQINTAKLSTNWLKTRAAACHVPHGLRTQLVILLLCRIVYRLDTAYAFCFSCHDEKIVREHSTDTVTDFRNGRLNLHYLHVNKENNGLACRACHTGHVSDQPKQISEMVRFGSWTFPMRFTQTSSGGSCLTGCHGEYSYDRVNPVQLRSQ